MNPYVSPVTPGEPAQSENRKPRLKYVELLVVVGIIAITIALFLPQRRTVGPSVLRATCNNRLKQIVLGLQNYESAHGVLPPAYTVDANGKPLHSWRTLILPYSEQKSLYETIDLSKPWDDPANKAAYEAEPYMYRCPAIKFPANHTTYLAVVGIHGCLRPTKPRKLSEITDEHGLTIAVIEVDAKQAVHWMSPMDASVQSILDLATVETPHPGGFQAAYVDGGTRFVLSKTKPARLRALLTIDGDDDDVVGSND